MNRPNPKMWGEASRRHGAVAQGVIALSRRIELPEHARVYFGVLAREALALLEQLEAEPADAPYVGRRTAIPCSAPECSGFSWGDARTLWDRERAGMPSPSRLCNTCMEQGLAPLASPQPNAEPLDELDMAELVEHRLDQLVELDALIFRDADDPELLAAFTLGRFAWWVHRWHVCQAEIAQALGTDEAARRIADVRETAGTAALVAPPDGDGIADSGNHGDGDGDGDGGGHEEPPQEADREQNSPIGEQNLPIGEQEPDPVDDREPWVF